jgi:hypothetical protein
MTVDEITYTKPELGDHFTEKIPRFHQGRGRMRKSLTYLLSEGSCHLNKLLATFTVKVE